MRKSQWIDWRPTKKKGLPRWYPVSRNGRPFMNSFSGDESPSLGGHIRGRLVSGNPSIPCNFQCQNMTRPDVRKSRSKPSQKAKARPLRTRSGPTFSTGADEDYLVIFATTPEPTVRPPSRIAKRRPSSMAIGAISLTLIVTLSPGITISVPSGRITSPVTSVVRK